MFEYHGWITIREGCCEEEDDEGLLRENLKEIEKRLSLVLDSWAKIELFVNNGTHFVRMDACPNHYHDWVLELFKDIGRIAKGSYGLLYIWDDEDEEHENEFQVWKMTKGTVEKKEDKFLSPCIPTLEE